MRGIAEGLLKTLLSFLESLRQRLAVKCFGKDQRRIYNGVAGSYSEYFGNRGQGSFSHTPQTLPFVFWGHPERDNKSCANLKLLVLYSISPSTNLYPRIPKKKAK